MEDLLSLSKKMADIGYYKERVILKIYYLERKILLSLDKDYDNFMCYI